MEAAFGVHISFVMGLPSIISREAGSRSFFPSHRAFSIREVESLVTLQLILGLRVFNHSSAQGDKPKRTVRIIIRLTLRSLETDWASPPKTRLSDFPWADWGPTTAWGYTWATVGK